MKAKQAPTPGMVISLQDAENFAKAIVILYDYFYKLVSGNEHYEYRINYNDSKLLERFILWLQQNYEAAQVGENFLLEYFSFQFSRYAGVVTPNGKNSIMLPWILGNKARVLWKDRNIKETYLVRYRITPAFKLRLRDAFKEIKIFTVNREHKTYLTKIFAHEEQERRRYFNTEIGYFHCLEMTTLCNPASLLCKKCVWQVNCKKRLQELFPVVYQLRFNNEINKA